MVGWPKDSVARAVLGRDVLFGDEAFDNRRAVDLVRPFEKGLLKYVDPSQFELPRERLDIFKKAARLLVEHAVSLTRPPEGMAIHGVIGAPSRASIACHQTLLEAAEATFQTVVVVPEPFAVAYGVNALQNTLIIDIGAATIDISPMYGVYPSEEDQVTVPVGGDDIDEEFSQSMAELYPESLFSKTMARDIKERYGFVHDVNDRAIVSLQTGRTIEEVDVTEPLKAACKTIVNPLIDGLREVISRIDPEYRPTILNNVLLSGGGSQLRGLNVAIEEALQDQPMIRVKKVYDCMFAGAVGAFKLAMAIPPDKWDAVDRVEGKRVKRERKVLAAA
jgi:rod shape-determining protein MreB